MKRSAYTPKFTGRFLWQTIVRIVQRTVLGLLLPGLVLSVELERLLVVSRLPAGMDKRTVVAHKGTPLLLLHLNVQNPDMRFKVMKCAAISKVGLT